METYIKQFSNLRTAIQKGKPAPHKAILLLSVMDLIASGKIQTPVIHITEELKQRFKQNWRTYVGDGREGNNSLIRTPFTYMDSEPFWKTNESLIEAEIDRRLFELLRIENNQQKLRATLIFEYLNKEINETPHKVDFSELDPAKDQSLRPYQIDNKQKIYQFWQDGRSVMLQMPTGTGKTRLFVSIVRDLHEWGAAHKESVKVLLLAHRVELIQQISENLGLKYNLAHGLIAANNPENRKYPIQVGSVPTMHRRMDKWADKDFDVIIVDEAHHVKADSYKTILKEYPNAKVLGVTATPYRLNGAGFRDVFQDLIISDPVAKFIKNGYLSNYDYYSIAPDSSVQKQIEGITEFDLNGDYRESALIRVMDTDRLRARIVDTYLKYANGKKGIIYTISQLHNENVCAQFNAKGITAKAIDSKTNAETRKEIVNDFRNGKFQILCNVNIFSEGFDCPDLEFVQLARPTKSLSMFLQQIGRGLRTAEGKDKVIFLDNVGLYNRFGLPSANRKWRMHFDGQEVTETELKGIKSFEQDRVRFMYDIEEGDEDVELVQSTLGVGVEDKSDIERKIVLLENVPNNNEKKEILEDENRFKKDLIRSEREAKASILQEHFVNSYSKHIDSIISIIESGKEFDAKQYNWSANSFIPKSLKVSDIGRIIDFFAPIRSKEDISIILRYLKNHYMDSLSEYVAIIDLIYSNIRGMQKKEFFKNEFVKFNRDLLKKIDVEESVQGNLISNNFLGLSFEGLDRNELIQSYQVKDDKYNILESIDLLTIEYIISHREFFIRIIIENCKHNKKPVVNEMTKCDICGVLVRKDRLEKHKKKAHVASRNKFAEDTHKRFMALLGKKE